MSKIVIFGAGGRAGRRALAEAVARGHQVTAVVRDPARHQDLAGPRVSVVAGDVTRVADVERLSGGHDAAIGAAARMDVPSREFFAGAAQALLAGLAAAGVGRLVLIGVGTTLEVAPGVAVHDTPEFPVEFRAFSLGHAAELEVLRAWAGGVDWLLVVPPPTVLDEVAERRGRYRVGGAEVMDDGGQPFSYAELAVVLVDEIESPRHHRERVAVAF